MSLDLDFDPDFGLCLNLNDVIDVLDYALIKSERLVDEYVRVVESVRSTEYTGVDGKIGKEERQFAKLLGHDGPLRG